MEDLDITTNASSGGANLEAADGSPGGDGHVSVWGQFSSGLTNLLNSAENVLNTAQDTGILPRQTQPTPTTTLATGTTILGIPAQTLVIVAAVGLLVLIVARKR